MNGVVAILALMGIAVAASELPLAFRKRETLLDIMKMDDLFAKAKRLQEVHVWLSLAMSFITYGVLFNYLNEYLIDVQKDNFDLAKGGKYSTLMLVLLGFYFLEFCLFTITAVANRAIIVAFFNSQVRAITEEQDRLRHQSAA